MTAPVNFAETQQALYTWLNTSTGLPTSWAFQERAQDNIAAGFAVMTLMSVSMPPDIEQDEERTVEAAGELYNEWVGTREIILNVQVFSATQAFAGHAVNLLSGAQATLRGWAGFEAAGLTFLRESGITNISAVAGAGYESRASMDITFHVFSVFTSVQPSGWFNQAVINGKQIGPP